MGITKK